MIFSQHSTNKSLEVFESYKERNFYYKVFAGYLFNELLPDYEKNKRSFFDLLKCQLNLDGTIKYNYGNNTLASGIPLTEVLNELRKDKVHVSFDYHLAQLDIPGADRGEVSDIIIWGKEHFISIEVKYLSDWTYRKDIEQVQQRIVELGNKVGKGGIQVLLLSEKKWLNNQKHLAQTGSNLNELMANSHGLEIPLIVLTWEQLAGIVLNEGVKDYVLRQLKRKKKQPLPG